MNFFWTGRMVRSSPSSGQLQEALPGPDAVVLKSLGGGSARSVPSVDSTRVFKEPMTTKRHGVVQGSVDSGVAGPPREISRSSGHTIEYSVPPHGAIRREQQYVRRRPASLTSSQVSPLRNSAGNTQPPPSGEGSPTGMSRS